MQISSESNSENLSASLNESSNFSCEQFAAVWKQFAKSQSKLRPRLCAILNEQIPSASSDNLNINFVVGSMVVKEYLYKNIHGSLEGYLREQLHNSGINLAFSIEGERVDFNKEKNNVLPYTSLEKYRYMLEKNSNLSELQVVFDLQTD